MPRKRSAGLPSRKQILDFIATSDQPAGKREIARAFGLRGQDKIDLKRLLNDMADEGLIDHSRGRAFHQAGGVPRVTVLRVAQVDDSGNVFAVPEQWHAETPPPRLRVVERAKRSALGIGDRLLARTEEKAQGWQAHPLKKLARAAELVLGVVRREGDRFWLSPVDKRERRELAIHELKEAGPGDLVLCEVSGRPPRVSARVDAVLGDPFAPRSFSLIVRVLLKKGRRIYINDGIWASLSDSWTGKITLPARFIPNHALEIPHHHRIGMRAVSRAEDVVRVAHVRDPVAHRFVHGFLERLLTRVHRHHFRAKHLHAKDVQPLPLAIDRAHVDDAL